MQLKSYSYIRPLLAAAFTLNLTFIVTATAPAASLSYKGTVRITSTQFPGEIDVGDIFDFTLTYDDAKTDIEVSPVAGNFPTALTAFTLTERVTNTGTWDPSVGNFTLPGRIQTQETQDAFRFQPFGTGFDTLDGSAFDGMDILMRPLTINDTGLGQTIAGQIGGPLPGELTDFIDPLFSIFNANRDFANGNLTAFDVPEPSTMSIALLLVTVLVTSRHSVRPRRKDVTLGEGAVG